MTRMRQRGAATGLSHAHIVNYSPSRRENASRRTFRGAVLDTGAPASVIGLTEARLYCKAMATHLNIKRALPPRSFRFGEKIYSSLGTIRILIPNNGAPLLFDAHVIPLDVPLLLGLDTLTELELVVDPARRTLKIGDQKRQLPLHHDGHLVLKCSADEAHTLYTRAEIQRLHRHFAHPSSAKLYNALRKAKPQDMDEKTRQLIDEITQACRTCQTISIRPLSFSVRMNGELAFNQEVLLDIMYYKNLPILHVVDAGTHFAAARLLPAVDVQTVWNAFVQCWSSAYIGHPESLLTDQGSVFLSQHWSGLCRAADIRLRHTGTESHNSLHVGETLHAPLRRILRRLNDEHPDIPDDHALSIAVHAMNSTANERGLCPMLLVFGVLPKLPDIARVLPSHFDRIKAMHAAREEYSKIIAERRVQKALTTAVPSAADSDLVSGDMVYVWREGPRQWMGPVPLAFRDGKDCTVLISDTPRSFNVAQLKRAPISDPAPDIAQYVFLTEVVPSDDPRSALFDDAKRNEILGLIERGTFSIVTHPEETNGHKPNVLSSRFVLAIKHAETGETKLKARFVIGGHRDREKADLVHVSNTVKHSSIRMLLAIAAMFGFDVWSSDVRQAYLQAATPLLRDVYVKPPKEAINLRQHELLKLLKPLYGLSDAGDYWSQTLRSFHTQHLHMKQATGDFALFFRHTANRLSGVSASHVDDLLCAGTPEFRADVEKEFLARFEMSEPDNPPLTYAGIDVQTSPYSLSQKGYITRLARLRDDATFDEFRSQRAKRAWVVHTRPDVAFAISAAAQVTLPAFDRASVRAFNHVVDYLQRTSDIALRFPPLDASTLQLVAYADASFGNLPNGASQLGHVIFLVDKNRQCSLLSFKSYKSRRIARSTTAAETLALADACDMSLILRHDLERILQRNIPILLLTDAQILFETLVSRRHTAERRLMIDLASLREAYDDKEIANIGLIASCVNAADALTKHGANKALWNTLCSATITHPVLKWVIERDRRSDSTMTC